MSGDDYGYDDFAIGDHISFSRRFSAADFADFARLSGDRNPLHGDAAYAALTPFRQVIVPVHLTAMPLSAIAGMMLPGHRSLYLGSEMRALKPVHFECDVTYSARIIGKNDARRILIIRVIALSEDDIVLDAEMRVQVRADVDAEAAPVRSDEHRPQPGRTPGTALVTGAQGAIGAATALALAHKGWDLLLQHRRAADADLVHLADRCRALGRQVALVQADLAESGERQALTASIRAMPELVGVVHCASPAVDAPLGALMAVNFEALSDLIGAARLNMLRRQSGAVVLVGSTAVHYCPSGWDAYVAAKAAASALVEGFERRFSPYGLRGRVVAPGFVDTPFSQAFRTAGEAVLTPEQVAGIIADGMDNGGYTLLEPGRRQDGHFGFTPNSVAVPAASAPIAGSDPAPPGQARAGDDFAQFMRGFLALGAGDGLEGAGVDLTPGWDSLRHIELMLEIERRFGVCFSATEIDKTIRYPDLAALVAQRRG